MLPVNRKAFLQFGDEGELVADEFWDGQLVREQAKQDKDDAGEACDGHNQGVA